MVPTTARRTTIATRTLKTSRKGKEKEKVMKGLSDASGVVQALGELFFSFFRVFSILTNVHRFY
jgi:hypothetical protein